MRVLFSICHHCAVAFPAGSCPECGVLPSATMCMNCGLSWLKTEYVPNHPYTCQEAPMPPVGVWTPDFTGQQPYEPEKPLDGSIPQYNPKWAWPEPQEITVDDLDDLGVPRQETLFDPEEMAYQTARWSVMWRYKRQVFESMICSETPSEKLIRSNQNRVHQIFYNLPSYKKAMERAASLRLQFPEKVYTVERVQ